MNGSQMHRQENKRRGLQRKQENRLATQLHAFRIKGILTDLGMSRFALASEEAHYLPKIVYADEQIGGVVYGLHQDGFALMAATDRRVIFLDKKPLFDTVDEIRYEVISGVSFGHAGIGSTITLHTKIKDYKMRTFNQKTAIGFVKFIESKCLTNGARGAAAVEPTMFGLVQS